MARYLYGGGGDGDIIRTTGLPYINATASIYNSRTGGTQITDLQNISGTAITQVTSDANGQVVFYGPDNYISVLWLDFGSGVRWALSPKAVDLTVTRGIAVQRAADAATPTFTAKAALPYNTADPLEQALAAKLDPLVIPRFASQAARDAAFTAPANGDRCYRTDLGADQLYDGTAWRNYLKPTDTQRGMTTFTFTSVTSSLITVTFPVAYPAGSVPIVTTNINSGVGATAHWDSRAINITNTQFQLFVFTNNSPQDPGTWSSVPVQWTAVAP